MFPVHTVNICGSYFDPQIKMNVSPPVPASETSITDGVYATLLSSVLGVSVLILCLSRFRVPVFGKDVAKLRRFLRYDHNAVDHNIFGEIKYARPERLPEWSFRMAVLLNVILLTLVILHAVILIMEGPALLRTVFVLYWVFDPAFQR